LLKQIGGSSLLEGVRQFELDQIRVPVSIWHGADDRNVGIEHAMWLSQHIPGAQLHIIEGEGHVSLIMRIDEVLDDLRRRAGLTAGH
jgi:pimeloyl-ACP methyl ester carboxylesterase